MLGALLLCPTAYAQLVPDFTSDITGLPIGPDGSGQTPFIDEIVSDPATGLSYHHLLLGSLADGFAQDVYIRTANTYFPNGGVGSASGGFNTGGSDVFGTGNGTNTGNPTSIIMRQLLNDGELAEEFLKDQTDKKPHITQLINAPDITAMFDADMSNSTYSDNTTPGTVINTLTLVDPNIPVGTGDFSMLFDGVTTTMEAGGQATQDQNV
ncbi:MAG: hypothetical protein FD130_2360, partial [Halothiobacillaceae bacterium]